MELLGLGFLRTVSIDHDRVYVTDLSIGFVPQAYESLKV
jgi:hypothetical protein